MQWTLIGILALALSLGACANRHGAGSDRDPAPDLGAPASSDDGVDLGPDAGQPDLGVDAGPRFPDRITADELAADPEPFLEREVWVEGPVIAEPICTQAGCLDDRPCNDCVARFALTDDDGALVAALVAAPGSPIASQLAEGPIGNMGSSQGREPPCPLCCHGHEQRMECAPSVPAAVTAVRGRPSRRRGFLQVTVDEVEVAPDAPTEQPTDFPFAPGLVYQVEPDL